MAGDERLPDAQFQCTRLVTRVHAIHDWRHPARALLSVPMEFGDLPMMRRMQRGIKDRAEQIHRSV